VGGELKKTCCRSTPRCRNCPVLVARARRSARGQTARPASLFDEIYGMRAAVLPESVTQALAALALAQSSRGGGSRERTTALSG